MCVEYFEFMTIIEIKINVFNHLKISRLYLIVIVTTVIKNIFKHFLNLDSHQLQAHDSTKAMSNQTMRLDHL